MSKNVTYTCDKCNTTYEKGHELASFTLSINPVVTYPPTDTKPLRVRKVSVDACQQILWCRECLGKADLLATEENLNVPIPAGDQLVNLIEEIACEAMEDNG